MKKWMLLVASLLLVCACSVQAIASDQETYFDFAADKQGNCADGTVAAPPAPCTCSAARPNSPLTACKCNVDNHAAQPFHGCDCVFDGTQVGGTQGAPGAESPKEEVPEGKPDADARIAEIFGTAALKRVVRQEVRNLQKYLNAYFGPQYVMEDGIFSFRTQEVLTEFQAQNGLKEDGIAGTETKKKLFEVVGDILQ